MANFDPEMGPSQDSAPEEMAKEPLADPVSGAYASPATSQEPNGNSGSPPAAPGSPSGASEREKVHCVEVEDGLAQLPPYARSLLRIKVPVMVTLAESRQPIQNVLDMGPGSIIHFNKPCEETLALEIAGQRIALGDAVKVGDKFGLWVTSMILPEERFWVISNRAQSERAK